MLDLDLALEKVKKWVKEAGDIQKEYFRKKSILINTKSTGIDLVTEVDELCEKHMLDSIKENYPLHGILSEESGKSDTNITSDYLWIVDPVDGTTNYAQGLPIFAISIALKYKDETILGVVYCPIVDQLFEAVKGKGAYLNGEKITIGNKRDLSECVLATGFPYDRAVHKDNNANYFAHLVPMVRGLRRMGSAAYDLANVAAGSLDGFWEINLSLWDIAAGELLIEEAGGKIVYLKEKRGISLVAGNEAICQKILDQIEYVDKIIYKTP
ncbi:inositol monophosphatase family protein [Paramaledivibacter caminithermalis]|jgi:myo-inositol-1(or 4)-monophosphatase|uniref:Inositol-1-monophosphatase n=1 Tax=Paramaledivibacter caminithermalis (strain DSM 15212 / CIP 107654 / DViRD3) TaxID=1121301 RepID=A0A1M6KQK6_PARC5|nr:inositol monophosphatase family protein [Paramaledivibacter caminithermalis]SHJ61205.1 myo-inositol-1(or 4)-monophosphatase [Paramaledivibacter caminithermalis DSM 15212]